MPNTTERQQKYLKLVGASLLGFFLLTIVAMLVYPGGTYTDPTTTRYLFSLNFFSDLGRLETFLGERNLIAMPLFVAALVTAAIGQVLYFRIKLSFFRSSAYRLAFVGSIAGSLTGLGYLGVALTPWDILGPLHLHFVHFTFLSFMVAVICYTGAIFRNPIYPNFYAWVFLSFAVILGSYLWLLFFGPAADTTAGLMIQAVGQKVIVYSQFVCMAFQLWGAMTLLKREEPNAQNDADLLAT